MVVLKRKKVLAVMSVAVVIAVTLFSLTPAQHPISLTFLYTTNAPSVGTVGVFRLENNLDEPIATSGGFYQRAGDRGAEPRIGDYGASLGGVRRFKPGVGTFQAWIPTNGGPYRLVLYCVPDSKATRQHRNSLRMRMLGLVSRLPVSQRFIGRWAGTQFTTSQRFEVPALKAVGTNIHLVDP
jgi:hypothetical protein